MRRQVRLRRSRRADSAQSRRTFSRDLHRPLSCPQADRIATADVDRAVGRIDLRERPTGSLLRRRFFPSVRARTMVSCRCSSSVRPGRRNSSSSTSRSFFALSKLRRAQVFEQVAGTGLRFEGDCPVVGPGLVRPAAPASASLPWRDTRNTGPRVLLRQQHDLGRLRPRDITGRPDGHQPHQGRIVVRRLPQADRARWEAGPANTRTRGRRPPAPCRRESAARAPANPRRPRYGFERATRLPADRCGRSRIADPVPIPGSTAGRRRSRLSCRGRTVRSAPAARTRSSGAFSRVEQLFDRLAGDARRSFQRAAGVRHAVHAAVDAIAIGIPQVVLHVADDRVVPVGEVDRPVGTDLEVGRAKVRIGRVEDRLLLGGGQSSNPCRTPCSAGCP